MDEGEAASGAGTTRSKDGWRGVGASGKGLFKNVSKQLLKSLRKDQQQTGVSQKRKPREL